MRALWLATALMACGVGNPKADTATRDTGAVTGTPAGATASSTSSGTTATGSTTTPSGTTSSTETTGSTEPTDTADTGSSSGTTSTSAETDRDGDGLSDSEEAKLGTDPDNPDTDGGGLTDGAELHYGRDPLNGADDKVDVMPDAPELRYVGRWVDVDPSRPWAGWQGASVSATFDGTAVSVVLDPGGQSEWFRFVIDGDHHGSTKVLIDDGARTTVAARGLEPGPHTIEVVKETNGGSRTVLLGMEIAGAGLVAPPPAPTRKIVFIGDSNLAGSSLEHESDRWGKQYMGAHFTYAGVASRRVDATFHNLAIGGETLGSMQRKLDRVDPYTEFPQWDFVRDAPDAIVMNLGANDVGRPEEDIRASYHSILDDIRSLWGAEVHIVVFNAWGWDAREPANYTGDVVAERDDPNLSVATFPWVFEQWHGCETDHAGMAEVLVQHLDATLGWSPGPSDVVSGYGVDGSVANGGFEQVAPFGGYGWRYRLDAGVVRLVDPSQAHSGEAFLRLNDGARTHQPNPARAGQTVTARLWVKGASADDEVRVMIDFRDQTMYTPPLQVTERVFALDTSWQEIVLEAEAPALDVWHTRLSIGSEPGSTVDVDDISMETE